MIAILIQTNRRSGIPEIVGVRAQCADVETWLAGSGTESVRVEIWSADKTEPDGVFCSLEEWEQQE